MSDGASFEKRNYDILWDQIELNPSIQLKFGVTRRLLPLYRKNTDRRDQLFFYNDYVELKGKWDNSPGFGSLLSLKLTNRSRQSLRIARLVFPAENGLDDFLKDFQYKDISFLRNGYQSWSTSRSYRVQEKPLRPWLQIVSLASSNLANLPSNTPGNLSSEMYSIITDTRRDLSFLVGQVNPFNQFFYIRLLLYRVLNKKSHFELVFDFGRKMIKPNETIALDRILMAKGEDRDLQRNYFDFIKNEGNIKILKKRITGWSSWYYYYNKITPESILSNVNTISSKKLPLDFIQIDDGYQQLVGDWLDLMPSFRGRMKEITKKIKASGFIPGIWIAPFIADKKSYLINNNPDFVIRTEYGKPIIGGYNPVWPGRYYYGLDITNPRFEEYIRNVIHVLVHEWGFQLLKLDFLFGGCLRGGNHYNFGLSRTEILKYGMKVIREAAGKDTILIGCGMPLTSGIGIVDLMRVGPDTAPQWRKWWGSFLQTGAMLGARNSTRNFMVRSMMNKKLWINDPDCLMLRKKKTSLNEYERRTHINSVILSGGMLLYSDNFSELSQDTLDEIPLIDQISKECFKGEACAIDLMEKEMPEIYYNSAGFLGVFNFKNYRETKLVNLSFLGEELSKIRSLVEVWTGESYQINDRHLILPKMPPHSSLLFKL